MQEIPGRLLTPGTRPPACSVIRELLGALRDPYSRFITPPEFSAMLKYDVSGVGLNLGTAEEFANKTVGRAAGCGWLLLVGWGFVVVGSLGGGRVGRQGGRRRRLWGRADCAGGSGETVLKRGGLLGRLRGPPSTS